ncbi:MAG: inositol monophosphatase family protein [Alphaproteobacteria bacterium]|jgi:myo-inositol-1(or 4)-monophosphatase
MAQRSPIINVIAATVDKAARILNRDFGEIASLQASQSDKGPDRFVSAALRRSGEIIAKELQRARRGFGYVQRGAAPIEGDNGLDNAWLVSPLDGLENFRRGLPGFSTIIGVRERGAIVAGAIYDPLRDELFWADRGTGAYANHQRIRATTRNRLDDAMVVVDGSAPAAVGRAGEIALTASGAAVRKTGASALDLAYVAAGRFDASIAIGIDDIAGDVGTLLVREAGAMLSTVALGDDQVATVAAGTRLERAVLACLAKSPAAPPVA